MNTAILTFQKTDFDVVDIHNVPWLRGKQIADALGYKNPSQAIDDIYSRNADEFSSEMTQIIELDTAGGRQPVRIFSPRGCYLIGMLARTELAKAFRQWVLDVLEGRQHPRDTRPMSISQQIAAHKLRVSLLKELKAETAHGVRRALYAQVEHVSHLLAIPAPALESIGRDVQQGELAL